MKDKIFGVLQRVGRSFMLPIALLPVAGLLLGIGSSFTNETMLAAYGLNSVIHPGTLIYTILDVMSQTGSAVFNNLALLFAMGVAIGMARKEKEVAALSGAVAYIIMNTAIQAMINAAGGVEAMPANSTTTMLGITTLQMGVFGGIVVGLGVAALHNKFYKIELPQVLAFFGGTRFVPIVSSIVYLVVGIAMFYIWPVVQSGIAALGALVLASGYAGTFIYGLLERALIPFGLHHVFYMPFWQTAVGGTAIIDGVTVTGAQNIFFAELASKSTTVFSVSATRFMAGKFPFMMFGLPGAALAMYQCAKPEKKKGGRRPAAVCCVDGFPHRHHRAAGIYLYLCGTAHVRGALRAGRSVLHADAHSECGRGHDLLRRSHRPGAVRCDAGQRQDPLDVGGRGRCGVLCTVLHHFPLYDLQV